MHYYSFNIGDYRRDTMHLSMLEHGAYRQLMDWQYLEQLPILLDTKSIFRKLSAKSEEEQQAILTVLDEFFMQTEAGYLQRRISREIAEYAAKADRARKVGKLGGRPRKTKEDISSLSIETKEEANHKPLTINQELITTSNSNPAVPAQKFINTAIESNLNDDSLAGVGVYFE